MRYRVLVRFLPPVLLLVAASLVACSTREHAPSEAPSPPEPPRGGGLYVSLVWNAPVDLDLYVTDSSWETLYFGNNPTRWGGELEVDRRCATLREASIERARVADPATGGYRVGVDFIDPCESDRKAVPYRVVVDLNGARIERTGTARLEVFDLKALEFEVAKRDDGRLELKVHDAAPGVPPR